MREGESEPPQIQCTLEGKPNSLKRQLEGEEK